MGREEDISRLLAGDDERIFYGKRQEKDEIFLFYFSNCVWENGRCVDLGRNIA